MKKKNLIVGILILLCISTFIFYRGKTVSVYIGVANESPLNGVDISLKINNVMVWQNNIHSGLNNYTALQESFKFGYNTIEVISKNRNLQVKKEVFVSINQYIVIEYFSPRTSLGNKDEILVEIRSGKFYYE